MALKVAIVSEYYYPLLGGISEHVHNTAVRLRTMGHEVKIITSICRNLPSNNGRKQFCDPEIVRIGHSVPLFINGSFARVTVGNGLRRDIRAVFEKERFDVIHVHSPLVLTLPLIAIDQAKCPVVGTFHTYFEKSISYSILKDLMQKRWVSKLDGQIAVSQNCIDSLSRFFSVTPRIIPNGVDVDHFNPSTPPIDKFNDGKVNLLFLGRLDPRNGLTLMLRAFALVKSRYPDVRLIIVGDGPLRSYYKKYLPQGMEDDIFFEGPKLEERNRYYACCDIFCSPVAKASFGVTLLEAMASGKPIAATENIGYKELLDPEEGFLVPPNDPGTFADTILHLIENKELRAQMGMNGRRKSLAYSWDMVTTRIADYYKEILSRK